MNKILLTLLFSLFIANIATAQQQPDSAYIAAADSLIQEYEQQKQREEVLAVIQKYEDAQMKREMSMQTDGVLPLARGLLLMWTDHNFVKQPSQFHRTYNRFRYPDYCIACAPLAATYILKAAGVQSRSKIQRMVTANSIALATAFTVSEGIKQTVNETCPDRSDNNSFPSVHVTMAFTSASILTREYGHVSPWIPVGSYSVAAASEMARLKHNKHWMHDLYMGAGIGQLSANLGYFLADRIFGADGINAPRFSLRDLQRMQRFHSTSSGLSLISGTETGNRSITMDDGTKLKTGASFSAGLDLSLSVTPAFSAELITRTTECQFKAFDTPYTFTGSRISLYHFDLGAKYSGPIAMGKRMGIRAFAGTRLLNGCTLHSLGKQNITYTIPDETKFECGLGTSLECLDKQNYVWGFTIDYFHTFSHYLHDRYSISSVWKVLF